MLKKKINIYLIQTLLTNQLHIGKKKKKWNKSLNLYLFGLRHDIFFFNIKKTQMFIKKIIYFLKRSIIRHHNFLFVGTGSLIQPLIKYLAVTLKQPCVNVVWVGGTLTSWLTIKTYAKSLYTKGIYKKTIEKYALKSEDKIKQKIRRYFIMKGRLKGLETSLRFPNMIICFDKGSNEYALHEAYLLQLPIICILNSNSEFSRITYPFLGNDNSFESLAFFGNLILNAIKSGFISRRIHFLKFNYINLKYKTILTKFRKKSNKIDINKIHYKKLNSFYFNVKEYNTFFVKKQVKRYYYYTKRQIIRKFRLANHYRKQKASLKQIKKLKKNRNPLNKKDKQRINNRLTQNRLKGTKPLTSEYREFWGRLKKKLKDAKYKKNDSKTTKI